MVLLNGEADKGQNDQFFGGQSGLRTIVKHKEEHTWKQKHKFTVKSKQEKFPAENSSSTYEPMTVLIGCTAESNLLIGRSCHNSNFLRVSQIETPVPMCELKVVKCIFSVFCTKRTFCWTA